VSVWLALQTEEALFAALWWIFYVTHDWLLRLMTTLPSISDSTRFIALCYMYW